MFSKKVQLKKRYVLSSKPRLLIQARTSCLRAPRQNKSTLVRIRLRRRRQTNKRLYFMDHTQMSNSRIRNIKINMDNIKSNVIYFFLWDSYMTYREPDTYSYVCMIMMPPYYKLRHLYASNGRKKLQNHALLPKF